MSSCGCGFGYPKLKINTKNFYKSGSISFLQDTFDLYGIQKYNFKTQHVVDESNVPFSNSITTFTATSTTVLIANRDNIDFNTGDLLVNPYQVNYSWTRVFLNGTTTNGTFVVTTAYPEFINSITYENKYTKIEAIDLLLSDENNLSSLIADGELITIIPEASHNNNGEPAQYNEMYIASFNSYISIPNTASYLAGNKIFSFGSAGVVMFFRKSYQFEIIPSGTCKVKLTWDEVYVTTDSNTQNGLFVNVISEIVVYREHTISPISTNGTCLQIDFNGNITPYLSPVYYLRDYKDFDKINNTLIIIRNLKVYSIF